MGPGSYGVTSAPGDADAQQFEKHGSNVTKKLKFIGGGAPLGGLCSAEGFQEGCWAGLQAMAPAGPTPVADRTGAMGTLSPQTSPFPGGPSLKRMLLQPGCDASVSPLLASIPLWPTPEAGAPRQTSGM